MATWKVIEGYPNYEVSDEGEVRSRTMWLRQHPRSAKSPYLKVRLYRNGVGKTHNVHQLVAAEFLGARPEGMSVCHGSRGQNDNSVSNLYYGTTKRNLGDDKRRDGTDNSGSRNPKAKLTENDIPVIRRLKSFLLATEIAELFNISVHTVYSIWQRRKWCEV